jgi:hypothetical protein
MANETVVANQADPAASGTANPAPEAGQSVQNPTTQADPTQSGAPNGDPASKGEPTGQSAFDVQKSYEELRKQFTRVTQDYSKDRKTWNQTLSELQALKAAHAQTAELLSKATQTPIDPARFYEDFKTQGPKVFDDYIGKQVAERTKQLEAAYVEQANMALLTETKLEKLQRTLDTKNYPDFAALEPVMQEIADDPNTPIDWNQPIGAVYDALYKLARNRSSESAVKAAEEFGKKQAEEAARKEAATAVPGSGKGGSVTADPRKMTAAQLRQHFISQGMVEEE